MRDAYIYHRYRKYKHKAFRNSDPHAVLKWRYWFKLYGKHELIWALE